MAIPRNNSGRVRVSSLGLPELVMLIQFSQKHIRFVKSKQRSVLSRYGSKRLQGFPNPKPRDDESEEHKLASQLAQTVAVLVVAGL